MGRTAGDGIYTNSALFKRYMASLGFVWVPTMGIGTGCKVHLRSGELPMEQDRSRPAQTAEFKDRDP
jgi:hypothetical protein